MLEEIRPVKVIAFVSPKGGTGRTTLAASLAEHYAALGLKTVLLDTADPPNAHCHFQSVRGDLNMLETLQADKIVVDTSPSFREFDRVDAVVLVVSPDLVQCIEPAKAIPKARAVVYNRRRPELPEEVVKSAFPNIPVITVDDDYQGCAAALAVNVPASNRSLKIAEAVGTLAAILGKGETD
ncbi:MAG: ParA family protein [Syntrophothermus sp.]|nr:ParA family protein [Syntrophothermus sp.]